MEWEKVSKSKGEIIDITPTLRSSDYVRGNEILKWIRDNHGQIFEFKNFRALFHFYKQKSH